MLLTDLMARRRRQCPQQCPCISGSACTLDCVHPGCTACLHRVECNPGVARRLAHMGIVPGVELTVLQDGGGPVLVAVGDTRIALGRGVARGLHVNPPAAADHAPQSRVTAPSDETWTPTERTAP